MRSAAGRRRLLHARGDVDGLPPDAAVRVDATSKQHVTGVHADAHVEARVAVLAQHPLTLLLAGVDQREPGTHRALRIVLAGFVRAEYGQHAVAGEFEHLAVVPPDDGRELRERTVHHRAGLLGVETLAQVGRADDVEEQNGGLLERLVLERIRGCNRQRGELASERSKRRIDDGIAQHRTLRFQHTDGGFEFLTFARHRGRGYHRCCWRPSPHVLQCQAALASFRAWVALCQDRDARWAGPCP